MQGKYILTNVEDFQVATMLVIV